MYDDDTEEIESDNYDDPNYDEEIERQDQSRFQESDSRILDFDDLQNELEEIKAHPFFKNVDWEAIYKKRLVY